jgi:hypothetical protein
MYTVLIQKFKFNLHNSISLNLIQELYSAHENTLTISSKSLNNPEFMRQCTRFCHSYLQYSGCHCYILRMVGYTEQYTRYRGPRLLIMNLNLKPLCGHGQNSLGSISRSFCIYYTMFCPSYLLKKHDRLKYYNGPMLPTFSNLAFGLILFVEDCCPPCKAESVGSDHYYKVYILFRLSSSSVLTCFDQI